MSDPYAAERHNPNVGHCGVIALSFDGRQLKMRAAHGTYVYPAASGKPVDGTFDYSDEAQRQKAQGPIPAGVYWIKPGEFWQNAWYKIGSRRGWGNYRITIHPFTTTQTHGRGGFFIHGGNSFGSSGCIDLATGMDQFYADLMKELAKYRECQIHLSVDYGKVAKP